MGAGPAEKKVTESGKQKAEKMKEDRCLATEDGVKSPGDGGRRAEEEVEEFYVRVLSPRGRSS